MYKSLFRPFLFALEPEKAHRASMSLFKTALAIPGVKSVFNNYNIENSQYKKEVFGLTFKNPIGLAAGFDKNAEYIPLMAQLGFGFIEVGTVTPRMQNGNEKPRLFRLPKDKALINRMGFNNNGVDAMVKNLSSRQVTDAREKYQLIIGANIGKNKDTPNGDAWKDYTTCFEKLFDHADYFVINVSSPNTPDLRELQDKQYLSDLLNRLQEVNNKSKPKPLLLKIAPDLNDKQINEIVEVVIAAQLNGIIAVNTTIERNNLQTSQQETDKMGAGGLSGKPLQKRSTDMIWYIKRLSQNKFDILGCGGIFNYRNVEEKFNAGASLVQLYTGLIYEGPGIVKNCLKSMG